MQCATKQLKEVFRECAVFSGCADLDHLGKALSDATEQQRSAIDALLDQELVGEASFFRHLAERLDMPQMDDLINPQANIKDLRKACSARLALTQRLLPLDLVEKEGQAAYLILATYDPFDWLKAQAAQHHLNFPVQWVLASRKQVFDGLQALYGVGGDTLEKLLSGREVDLGALETQEEVNVLDEVDDEASVVRFVNQFIRGALEQRATDIHVEPLPDDLRIRYRIDGVLQNVLVPENIKSLQPAVIARLKVMASLDIAERRLPQDGRIHLESEGQDVDVRVATVPTVEGESVSLRLLMREAFDLERLQVLPHIRKTVDRLLSLSNGIILLTGPTGCGKSTSLYCFLSTLNVSGTRIVTVEDPVEHKLEGVMQIAVKPEINLTFAAGLRSILRADPNVIMVGEIRDLETAQIAIRSALTGHLVFSTLHTNDAVGGIARLTDMGLEPFLVAASVRAFMAQRLVRRLCEKCKEPADLAMYREHSGQVYRAVGCDACRGTGYQGRLAIYEICVVSPKIEELITAKASSAEILERAAGEGFVSLREYGWMKVFEGETTPEEVLLVTTTDGREDEGE